MTTLFADYMDYEREMLESAFNAITQIEAWEFLKNYDPPQDKGFMWDNHSKVQEIQKTINEFYGGHSGSSMAWTIWKMKTIAKTDGWKTEGAV
jgi:hypothetical protein